MARFTLDVPAAMRNPHGRPTTDPGVTCQKRSFDYDFVAAEAAAEAARAVLRSKKRKVGSTKDAKTSEKKARTHGMDVRTSTGNARSSEKKAQSSGAMGDTGVTEPKAAKSSDTKAAESTKLPGSLHSLFEELSDEDAKDADADKDSDMTEKLRMATGLLTARAQGKLMFLTNQLRHPQSRLRGADIDRKLVLTRL